MTTLKAVSTKESLPIGEISTSPSTSVGNVIFGEFTAQRPIPLPNTVSLESLLQESEADPIKAKYFVITYGAIELYLGIINNPADNVAHFAHLGGMLFGFLLLKYWQKDRNTFY